MRVRNISWLAVGLMAMINSGCGWFGGNEPSGGVAVVDLDEVARHVGADVEIAQAVKAREANLNSQLNTMKTNYVQQLKHRKELYGDEPTDEQSNQLVSISRQINVNLATAKRKAVDHLSSHRSKLIMQFREQVSPVARDIAKQRGLSLVVPKNEGWLLAVDESVDITDEVATSLKAIWKPITTIDTSSDAAQPQVAGNPPAGNAPAESAPPAHSHGVQPAGHHEPATPGQ